MAPADNSINQTDAINGVNWSSSTAPEGTSVTDVPVAVPLYQLYISRPQLAGQVCLIIVVSVLTIFGNCIMCYAVHITPTLRTVTNLFTLNLAATGLGIGFFVLPMWVISMTTGAGSLRSPIPEQICQITAFITVTLTLASVATLAGISLDRYFSICYPLRYPMEVTSRRAHTVLAYIWLQSVAMAITPLFGWGLYEFRPESIAICGVTWRSNGSHAVFLLIVGLVLPFAIMIFSYTRIIQAARKQTCRIERIQLHLVTPWVAAIPGVTSNDQGDSCNDSDLVRGDGKNTRVVSALKKIRTKSFFKMNSNTSSFKVVPKNIKTLKTVFIVVGAFFVCWMPYVGVNLWSIGKAEHASIPYMADLLTTLMAFFNSAVNPLVFMMLTRDLRYAIKLMFTSRRSQYEKNSAYAPSGGRMLSARSSLCCFLSRDDLRASRVPADSSFTPRGSCDSGVVLLDPNNGTRGSEITAQAATSNKNSQSLLRCTLKLPNHKPQPKKVAIVHNSYDNPAFEESGDLGEDYTLETCPSRRGDNLQGLTIDDGMGEIILERPTVRVDHYDLSAAYTLETCSSRRGDNLQGLTVADGIGEIILESPTVRVDHYASDETNVWNNYEKSGQPDIANTHTFFDQQGNYSDFIAPDNPDPKNDVNNVTDDGQTTAYDLLRHNKQIDFTRQTADKHEEGLVALSQSKACFSKLHPREATNDMFLNFIDDSLDFEPQWPLGDQDSLECTRQNGAAANWTDSQSPADLSANSIEMAVMQKQGRDPELVPKWNVS